MPKGLFLSLSQSENSFHFVMRGAHDERPVPAVMERATVRAGLIQARTDGLQQPQRVPADHAGILDDALDVGDDAGPAHERRRDGGRRERVEPGAR